MSRKAIAQKFTLLVSLPLFLVAGSFAGRGVPRKPEPPVTPRQSTCATVTDEQIRQAIFKIIRADRDFNTVQKRKKLSFDVTVTNKMVSLDGSVDKAETFTKVLRLIRAATIQDPNGLPVKLFDCYAGINVLKFFSTAQGHCGEHEIDCKGKCISDTKPCEDFGTSGM